MTDRVVVVGGGIAGLAAAWSAVKQGADVTVLEAGDRLGGKIRTERFGGVDLDTGPDAFLARVPDAIDLCGELGLGDELVAPGTGTAFVWTRGRLRRLPDGLVLGVPSDLTALARSGILSPAGVARASLDAILPGRALTDGRDAAVFDVVASRFGNQVAARLVDPLLGGINAGRTEELSVEAGAPQLAAAAREGGSLLRALLAARPPAPADGGPPAPVFLAPRRGMGSLVDALADALRARGAHIRTATAARGLDRAGGSWRVDLENGASIDSDAVVIATPADAAAALVRPHAPAAADVLGGIEYASVALVTLAYPRASLRRPLDGSGFLVPRPDGRLLTACSFATSKWPHLDAPDGTVLFRASAGRFRDERAMDLDDDALVERITAELALALGLRTGPTASKIHRWVRSFPQYAVGHLDRVAQAEAALAEDAPGLALAGAALRGVGIPACIASGRRAVSAVLGGS